jgi:hypothetical protein
MHAHVRNTTNCPQRLKTGCEQYCLALLSLSHAESSHGDNTEQLYTYI